MGKKQSPHAIPPHPKKRVRGVAYDIKCFPPSRSGRTAPFANPPPKPPAKPPMPTPVQIQQHFDNWVAFFVDFIGSKIERLNGLQFNLDNPGAGGGVNPMRDQLGDLADALGMTLTNSVSEPNELYWPLAGPYKITWDVPEAQKIGFDSLVLDLFFENEPDYRMVVNCSVELTVTIPGAGAPVSSSSSYVATSSSG